MKYGWLAFLAAVDAGGGSTEWSYSAQRPDAARRLLAVERAVEEATAEARRTKKEP
jgi:hypothetical protein